MNVVLSLDANWQPAATADIPASLAPWLLEPASLTARLKAYSDNFHLQLLQESQALLPDFLQPCFTTSTGQCLRREVLMSCNDQPAVYAQSWLPKETLQQVHALSSLGEQPLGELLFQFADVTRSPIEVCQLPVLSSTLPIPSGEYWARRSLFTIVGVPMLVAEVFLPGVNAL